MNDSQPFDAILPFPAANRRDFIRAGLGSMAVGFFGGAEILAAPYGLPFSFPRIGVSTYDDVKVPKTYRCEVLYAWGDPVDGVAPQFQPGAQDQAAAQALQAGMGHDGMEWFPFPGDDPKNSSRGLLVMNHEYSDPGLLLPNGLADLAQNAKATVDKMKAAHGISVIAVEKSADGKWKVIPSKFSRRITADTAMEVTGPAKGSPYIETRPDANNQPRVYGTFNNCAAGKTPWGTYLTCEENFHNYFGSDLPVTETAEQKRYGLKAPWSEVNLWWKGDERFDLAKHPNEANAFGYVVEIDPEAPAEIAPRKLTALGRFKHENAAVTLAKDERVVVYMGDDEKGEYIYKFVSKQPYTSGMPKADAQKLLEAGDLYAAVFEKKSSGETIGKWVPLHQPGEDLAKVCVFTRMAAQNAGATPMDRPEWVAVHPGTNEVFVTLTNNDKRGIDTAVDAANPRPHNVYGHIVKWVEDGSDPSALSFRWDIFLLAGDPATFDSNEAGKPTIKGDMFGSPDGLKFDNRGRILWIQTDVSAKVAGTGPYYQNLGNNMMLAADPVTGVVHRFLTGPRGCEITGLAMTPDSRTLFVNIQHPGESPEEVSDPKNPKAVSSWPHNADRPRSATVVITHLDGKEIGA